MHHANVRHQLHTRGFVRLPSLIQPHELAWLRALFAQLFGDQPPADPRLRAIEVEGRDSLPQAFNPSERLLALRHFTYTRRLVNLASELLGEPAQFLYDHMLHKPAIRGGETPWHQDQAYLDPTYVYTTINFWLPLEDATLQNGCMHYVPGSHLHGVVPHRRTDITNQQSALVASDVDHCRRHGVPMPCPAGSAILHRSYTLHYSGTNRSPRPREVYLVVCGLPRVAAAEPRRFPWFEMNAGAES